MRKQLAVAALAAAALWAQNPSDDKRLIFSTYLGGNRTDDAAAVAVDASGCTYVAGRTDSQDFSGKGFGDINLNYAVSKAFLTKYSADGREILWSHIFGGSSNTRANAVTTDNTGNVYVAGTTGATDFPLLKPVQDKQTGLNIAFLMKFDPDGKLLFSTYLGGDRNEEGLAVAVDSRSNIYLAGRATSTNFPVRNAMQPQLAGGGQDGFLAKFTPDYQLEWATYIGGTAGTDNIYAIAIGPDDAPFIAGETMSPNLATENAWIRQPVSWSSFVARVNPDGKSIAWLSYLGHRSGYTKANALAVDGQGRAWVGGHTSAKGWPMSDTAFQPNFAGGHRDGFLLRMSADGSTAEYATFLGGSYTGDRDPDDTVEALRTDWRGHVYVTGETFSTDFPTHRTVQQGPGGATESYLLKLDPENRQILYSTFWGGSKRDVGTAIALGPGENVTFAGETFSDNLPLHHEVRKQFGPTTDAFVARICDPWPAAWPAATLSFTWQSGAPEPAAQETNVVTGCTVPHELGDVSSSVSWVRVRYEERTAPVKLVVDVDPANLPTGEYRGEIKVTVPTAFYPDIIIPVTLTVTEPPPAEPAATEAVESGL